MHRRKLFSARITHTRAQLAMAVVGLASFWEAAHASTYTWAAPGSSGTFETGANWSPSAPTLTQFNDYVFNSGGASSVTVSALGNHFNSITFQSGSPTFNFTGPGNLEFGSTATTDANATVTVASGVTNNVTFAMSGGTYDGFGSAVLGGNSTLTLENDSTTASLNVNTQVYDFGNGPSYLALDIAGAGSVSFGTGAIFNSLNGGSIILADNQSSTGSLSVAVAATFAGATFSGGNATFASLLTSSAGITVNSGATLTSTYYNPNALTISVTGTFTNNGSVVLAPSTGSAMSVPVMTGNGSLTLTSNGGMIFEPVGASTYTGDTIIKNSGLFWTAGNNSFPSSSRLVLGVGGAFDLDNTKQTVAGISGVGNIASYGGTVATSTLTDSIASSTQTFSGTISQAIDLVFAGAGTQILSGNNTYSGSTTISGGTLQLGAGGTAGGLSTSSSITDNATLAFDRSNLIKQGTDFSGSAIGGTGGIVQEAGTLSLTAANSYSGGTSITGGLLQVGNNSALGNSAGALSITAGTLGLSSYTVTVGSASLAGSGIIFGPGSLTVSSLNITGAGNVIASGTVNAIGGAVIGNAGDSGVSGSVAVNGTLSSTVNVYTGTLSGSGVVSGAVITHGGSVISPAGAGTVGTLAIGGGLTVGPGDSLVYDLNGSSVSTGNDLLSVTGSLSLTTPSGATSSTGDTIVFNSISGGTPVLNQAYTLVTYTSSFSGTPGNLLSSGVPAHLKANFSNSGSALQVTFNNKASILLTNSSSTLSGAGYSSAYSGTSTPPGSGTSSTITLSGGSGSYKPGYLNNIGGQASSAQSKNFVTVSGFDTTGPEIFGLHLSITDSTSGQQAQDLADVISDLQYTAGSGMTVEAFSALGTSYGNVAALLTADDPTNATAPFNIAIIDSSGFTPGSPLYLGLDFTNETGTDGTISNVQVTDIGVVPEPTALIVLPMIAAAGLGIRRRRPTFV